MGQADRPTGPAAAGRNPRGRTTRLARAGFRPSVNHGADLLIVQSDEDLVPHEREPISLARQMDIPDRFRVAAAAEDLWPGTNRWWPARRASSQKVQQPGPLPQQDAVRCQRERLRTVGRACDAGASQNNSARGSTVTPTAQRAPAGQGRRRLPGINTASCSSTTAAISRPLREPHSGGTPGYSADQSWRAPSNAGGRANDHVE